MIPLTKQNDELLLLNPDQIELVTATPDTTIKMLSGKYYIVKETPEELTKKVIEFRKEIFKDAISGDFIQK